MRVEPELPACIQALQGQGLGLSCGLGLDMVFWQQILLVCELKLAFLLPCNTVCRRNKSFYFAMKALCCNCLRFPLAAYFYNLHLWILRIRMRQHNLDFVFIIRPLLKGCIHDLLQRTSAAA
jgi:hypothetical protein